MARISVTSREGLTFGELRRFIEKADLVGIPDSIVIRTRNKFGGREGAKVTEISASHTED